MEQMVVRKELLKRLDSYKHKDLIKIITGVRRCGKSTLFLLFQEKLRREGVEDAQIIHINLESIKHKSLLDYEALHDYISERCVPEKMTYIFIDEVQMCPKFELAVNSLYIEENTDIYLTGSNAYLLSGEIATYISGRYIEIPVLPLSFREFYQETPGNKRDAFTEYMERGAFPYLAVNEDTDPSEYLEGIYQTIVEKDIVQREKLGKQKDLLSRIVKTVLSSVGSRISMKKIVNTLNSSGSQVDSDFASTVLESLCNSYFFYEANQYDIQGRELLRAENKYYCVDLGFRSLLVPTNPKDFGHQIENLVFLELKRRGYHVFVGKNQEREVDFVAKKRQDVLYVQVSQSVLDENTRLRELASLETIPDHFPKLLLTLDDFGNGTLANGIKQENLIDWLLD